MSIQIDIHIHMSILLTGAGPANSSGGVLTPPTLAPVLDVQPFDPDYQVVNMSWSPSNKTDSPGFEYLAQIRFNGGAWTTFNSTTDTYTVYNASGDPLPPGLYEFRVIPSNDVGNGPPSNIVEMHVPSLFGLPFALSQYASPQASRVLSGPPGTRITWQSPIAQYAFGSVSNGRVVIWNTYDNYGAGYLNGELSGAPGFGSVLCRASIMLTGTSVAIPLTFSGAQQVTIPDGGYVISDPIAATITQGGYTDYTLCRIEFESTVTDQRMPVTYGYDPVGGAAQVIDDDVVYANTRAIPDDGGDVRLLYAAQLLGTTVGTSTKYQSHRVCSMTDSIGAIVSTPMSVAGVAWMDLGSAGHSMRDYASRPGYASARRDLWLSAPTLIQQRSVNDWQQDSTLAQMQSDFLQIAEEFKEHGGKRLIFTTTTPLTTSTDGWTTVANQTERYADWGDYNAWLLALTPSEVFGLELYCIDTAPYCSSVEYGLWDAALTNDGIHLNAAGNLALAGISSAVQAAILADFL